MKDIPDEGAPRREVSDGAPSPPAQPTAAGGSQPGQQSGARLSGEAPEAPAKGRRRRRKRRRRGAAPGPSGGGAVGAGDAAAQAQPQTRGHGPARKADARGAQPTCAADEARRQGAQPTPAPPREGASPGRAQAEPRKDEPRRRGGSGLLAALDLGTNNCRLLIARPEGAGFAVVDAFSRVVRLGEGLGETGRLSDAACDRAVDALKICAERLARRRIEGLRAIATEACRRATNRDAFIERVRRETGLALEVISPETEARLAVAGCAPLFDPSLDRLVVFDIGGGSTELIQVDLSRVPTARRTRLLMALAEREPGAPLAAEAAAAISGWVSLPAGVVTLGERFDHVDDDAERFRAMHGHVVAALAPFVAQLDAGAGAGADSGVDASRRLARLQLLGTSGTITTLAGVHLELERYSRRMVDGLWISAASVERVIERLLQMNDYERAQIPCVGEDRATNLMSGAAILRAILEAWPTQRLRVADRGLREGMLYGLLRELGRRRGGRGRREPPARQGGEDGR